MYLRCRTQNTLRGKNERVPNYKHLLCAVLRLATLSPQYVYFLSCPYVWDILIKEMLIVGAPLASDSVLYLF